MPRHAPALECSAEVKSRLMATGASRTEEVRQVERARIILGCLEGKEIQQVASESGASIPTVSTWRKRFAQQGVEGLRDRPRSGKPPRYGAVFRDRVLA
jgi:transposase